MAIVHTMYRTKHVFFPNRRKDDPTNTDRPPLIYEWQDVAFPVPLDPTELAHDSVSQREVADMFELTDELFLKTAIQAGCTLTRDEAGFIHIQEPTDCDEELREWFLDKEKACDCPACREGRQEALNNEAHEFYYTPIFYRDMFDGLLEAAATTQQVQQMGPDNPMLQMMMMMMSGPDGPRGLAFHPGTLDGSPALFIIEKGMKAFSPLAVILDQRLMKTIQLVRDGDVTLTEANVMGCYPVLVPPIPDVAPEDRCHMKDTVTDAISEGILKQLGL